MSTPGVRSRVAVRRVVATAAAGCIAIGATALGAPAAHAVPPISIPLPAGIIDYVGDSVPCGPLRLEVTAGETQRVFLGQDGQPRFAVITGQLGATLTNTETHKSLSLKVPGPGRITADGFKLLGPSLILGPNEVWLTHGPVFFPNGALDPTSHQGQYTDLCPLLS